MTIKWITIKVADFNESKSFYQDYLGMDLEREFSPNEMMTIAFLKDDKGTEVELIYEKNSNYQKPYNSVVSVGICSNNYEKLLQESRERGIITAEPATLGGQMECFFVSDPNGIEVQIIKGE